MGLPAEFVSTLEHTGRLGRRPVGSCGRVLEETCLFHDLYRRLFVNLRLHLPLIHKTKDLPECLQRAPVFDLGSPPANLAPALV